MTIVCDGICSRGDGRGSGDGRDGGGGGGGVCVCVFNSLQRKCAITPRCATKRIFTSRQTQYPNYNTYWDVMHVAKVGVRMEELELP